MKLTAIIFAHQSCHYTPFRDPYQKPFDLCPPQPLSIPSSRPLGMINLLQIPHLTTRIGDVMTAVMPVFKLILSPPFTEEHIDDPKPC